MLQGFCEGFKQNGVHCQIIHPHFTPGNEADLHSLRLQFNLYLSQRDYSKFDFIIGSDFDGFLLPDRWLDRYYAVNGGLLADLLQFEKGRNADLLRELAEKEKRNILRAQLVFVPSQYSAQKLQHLYGISRERICVVPLGIDFEYWQKLLRAVHRTNKVHTKRILCVARHYVRKGIDDLIRAVQQLHDRLPSVRLDLVGDGPEQERLKRLTYTLRAESYIHFEGGVKDQKKLAAYYRHADVFCLPSYHETFGLVFLEAMAAALPVVSYASTSIPEVVTPQTGMLCPVGDLSCLVNSLFGLLMAENNSVQMGRQGRKRAQEMSWHKTAKHILNALYTNAAPGAKS